MQKALRKLSEACEFDTITPNEILRDRLIFGIHDTKVRERLLLFIKFALKRTLLTQINSSKTVLINVRTVLKQD